MLKTLARFALLRVLPRRILPIVTVVEVILFLRSIRNRSTVQVNEPSESRPGAPAGSARSSGSTDGAASRSTFAATGPDAASSDPA
jgi:hypothetical protein